MGGITTARHLGAAVRSARNRAGVTQAALALESGVSRAWLAKFEAGHRTASIEQIFKVLEVLKLELALGDRAELSGVHAEIAEALEARRAARFPIT